MSVYTLALQITQMLNIFSFSFSNFSLTTLCLTSSLSHLCASELHFLSVSQLCAIPLHSYSNAVCQGNGLPGGEPPFSVLLPPLPSLNFSFLTLSFSLFLSFHPFLSNPPPPQPLTLSLKFLFFIHFSLPLSFSLSLYISVCLALSFHLSSVCIYFLYAAHITEVEIIRILDLFSDKWVTHQLLVPVPTLQVG